MEATLKQLNIDKSTWVPIKFGDIAKEPKENAKDLQAEGIEHVVGLEHIDTEDVHLRRSANLEESTTFTKKFAKGDVLFGRRRAYLKKAAQASFSGICSGDITVFRAKDGIIPELLPFVVCNDKFFDYAVKYSAGGLSPRVKFKDLANYEFLLPPKDQQNQLAELLWAMDDVIEKEKVVHAVLQTNRNVCIIDEIKSARKENNKILLGDIVNITTGKLDSNAANKDGVYPFFTCSPETLRINKYAFDTKAILLAGNNAAGVFPLKYYEGKFNAYQRTYVITLETEAIIYKYLLEIIRLELDNLKRQSVGSSTKFITMSVLMKMKVPKISLTKQEILVSKINSLDESISYCEKKLSDSKFLQKSLINQIF